MVNVKSLIILCCMCITSCESIRNTPSERLRVLLIQCAQNGQTLLGHQDDIAYGTKWISEQHRSDIYDVAGTYPALVGWDLGRLEYLSETNIDNVPFQTISEGVRFIHSLGGINTFSWHANNPVDDTDSWSVGQEVVSEILPGGRYHDKFIGWFSNMADYLLTLRNSNGELIPLIFRPWHEHNGDWFWWGKKWCSPQEYKELWKMTYEYFNDRGLNNLLWAYSPSPSSGKEDYMERFPGKEYVDLLGLDIYQEPDDIEGIHYSERLRCALDDMESIGKELNLPIAITETGFEQIPDPDWWTTVLLPVIEPYPVTYVMLWRNAYDRPNHYYVPFPGQASEEDFLRFVACPNIWMMKNIKYIGK